MRFVVDANIIVSSILGRRNAIEALLSEGAILMAVEAQLAEAVSVLMKIAEIDVREAREIVDQAVEEFVIIVMTEVAGAELTARQRLGPRGQPDWPVLAASITFGADIWSNDRDFFGVGVPVWSIRNISYAIRQGALNA